MFGSVLVANRGEIAVRVLRTLRRMGVRGIAVHSDADADAAHVAAADEAVRIGPAPAAGSYLSIEAILAAAKRTGAEAIHPGYGFLSENAGFARACADAGLAFVGPPPEAITAMGDKIAAKATASAAGVPVVPGSSGAGLDDGQLAEAAAGIGYPVLVKPSAGGGGKGMRLVEHPDALGEALAAARREARAAFGDDTLLLERYVTDPRHIEVQILADQHGGVVHLGERECSLQRRHQKIVEEAPSVLLPPEVRERIGAAAVAVARAVDYVGAGTVEFVVPGDEPERFAFMEMNTRLQVEHPVTELVFGLDLVEWQLRVAAGEPLGFAQSDLVPNGHAVEARVYAEDPARGFVPTGGRVLVLREPAGDGVRVDSGLRPGFVVGGDYDPMLAKVIAWAPDRPAALNRLDAALAATSVLGVRTNVGFLRALLADPDVRAGRLDTTLVDRRVEALTAAGPDDDPLLAAALWRLLDLEPADPDADLWSRPGGWRLGPPAWSDWSLAVEPGGRAQVVRTRGRATAAEVALPDLAPQAASASRDGVGFDVRVGDDVRRYTATRDGDLLWLVRGGREWTVRLLPRFRAAAEHTSATGGQLTSPMPGTVLAVKTSVGATVAAGAPLVVVEAMKMEHVVTAPAAGVVAEIAVQAGQQVGVDQVLVSVVPAGDGE